jgi:hypothetical protein
MKQRPFDELREDRRDLNLHVPLLSGNPEVYGHVLQRELKLNRQTPQLHHLAQADPDGHRPDVPRRRVPVRQYITRVPAAPALAKEECGESRLAEVGSLTAQTTNVGATPGPVPVIRGRSPPIGTPLA